MKGFLIALQFLTILPIKINKEIKKEDFGKSLLYFPAIGLLLGLVLSLTALFLGFLPNLVLSALILIESIIITGGIHLDGFADTCDGFCGGRTKEKILNIMRDSKIGVMGAIGIVSLLMLKFTLITSIPRHILWKSLIMMAVFSRWSQVLACFVSAGYARREGKAKYFLEYDSRNEFLVGAFFTLVLFILLSTLNGIIVFLMSLLPVIFFIFYVKEKIGGMTGDTIGATSEIAEISCLLFNLILIRF